MLWADYSAGRPAATALRAAGFTGVLRYVGVGGAQKRLTAGEYRALVAAGLQVLVVVERLTTDADAGYAAGLANAKAALADLESLGLPPDTVVFAAADEPAPNLALAVPYVRGFRDVLGLARTGAYGFGPFLQAVRANGAASVLWQAGHPPAAGAGVHFWQRNGSTGSPATTVVDGVQCDISDQLLPLPAPPAVRKDDLVVTNNFPAGQNQTGYLLCPVGTRSLLVANAWLSLGSPGTNCTFSVSAIGDDGAVLPAGRPLVSDARMVPNKRWVTELPNGTTALEIRYSSDQPLGWCIETQPK